MAQNVRSGRKTAKPAPRRRSQPRGIAMGAGLAGVFVVCFVVGVHGPWRASTAEDSKPPEQPVIASAPQADPVRVSIRELPADRAAKVRRSRARHHVSAPHSDSPSPPAVSTLDPTLDADRRPSGSARVADDAPAASDASSGDGTSSGNAGTEGDAVKSEVKLDAGHYTDRASANARADRLAAAGYKPEVNPVGSDDSAAYDVRVGPFGDRKAAEAAMSDLNQQGIDVRIRP